MSAVREALLLPGLFLTVTLLGGLRAADAVRLVPPPLSAIVLAVVLVGALFRAGVLVPAALLDANRRPLENLTGMVVLLTLLAASAQAIHLVVPDRGLLHGVFVVFLFVQLLSLSAAGIDRRGMLRSLFVLLGSAFVLRFIVLESLYAADGGALKRVLTAMMAGMTLGGIEYQPHAALTGYVAFATLALYLAGLVLLPARPATRSTALTTTVHDGLTVPLLVAALALTVSCSGPAGAPEPAPPADGTVTAEQREAALASARVWMAPRVPPASADFTANPEAPPALREPDVACRFVPEVVGGLTPKFNCQLADGTVVKVKYGRSNQEIFAEVAATRLIAALGFGADRMHVVRSIQCAGCPPLPFQSLRCLARTGLTRMCFPTGIDYESVAVIDPAAIEQRLDGRKIEAVSDQGWAWYELDRIDPVRGGSPRAEVDALKLLAVFLAHWDNKGENQRLICLPGGDRPDGSCATPFAIMQDVGSTFGPTKLDLRNWRNNPIWADAGTCRVSMERLPWQGATFPEQRISEEGRRFLLGLLEQLSPAQIETLFTVSRATTFDGITAEGRSAAAWARAFGDKVRQIREAGPCGT
jgi:hypothetical protein